MKIQLSILFSLLSFLLLPLHAEAESCGGSCGGGGLRLSSTAEEVNMAAKNLGKIITPLLNDAIKYQLLNPVYVSDPSLRAVLQKMATPHEGELGRDPRYDYFLMEELANLKIVVKDSCPNRGHGDVDASTDFKRNAEICMNRKRLMELRPDELRLQMVALVFHEWAHHFQPSPSSPQELAKFEREAEALQKYILGYFKDGFSLYDATDELAKDKKIEVPISPTILFAGGKAKFRVVQPSSTLVQFSCSTQASSLFNLPEKLRSVPNDAIVLAPGAAVTINWRSGDVAYPRTIICRNWPAIDCKIKKSIENTYTLFLGDYSWTQHAQRPEDLAKHLKEYQELGICRSGE